MYSDLVVVLVALPINAIVEMIVVVEVEIAIIIGVHLIKTVTCNAMHAALLEMVLNSAKTLTAPSEF